MGYYLRAFIGKETTIKILQDRYNNSNATKLQQGFALIPMTEELFDEINRMKQSDDIDKFELLTENVEYEILQLVGNLELAYVESEFHGGKGGHSGIIWKDCERKYIGTFKFSTMNTILKKLGIKRTLFLDEFQTLNLDRYRNTEDWIK